MITLHNTRGERSRTAKLTQQQVDHLRMSYTRKPADMTQIEFCADWGALFGVTMNCVRQVIHGINWREHRI